jgi:ABC-type uncharacterized transport system fused permease/ATPase subunit
MLPFCADQRHQYVTCGFIHCCPQMPEQPLVAAAAACRQFTDAALGLSLTILNSLIDLVSFSGILYSIYPPLFAALLAYSIGGTLGSIALGKVRAVDDCVLWILGQVHQLHR